MYLNTIYTLYMLSQNKFQKPQSKQHMKETSVPSLKLFHGFNALLITLFCLKTKLIFPCLQFSLSRLVCSRNKHSELKEQKPCENVLHF